MFTPNLLAGTSREDSSMRSRIVVVDDEPDLRDAVAEYLAASGYDVTVAGDAAAMREIAREQSFNLAILDISMPGEDGLSLGRWLRSKMPVGIIFATASGTSIDRIVGLELGADDYIVKPYELRELLARVRSVLRRVPPPTGLVTDDETPARAARRVINFGSLSADLDGRIVTGPEGSVIDMAKSEFDVLEVFLTRANRLLSRAAIAEAIGFADEAEDSRALDIRIMRLRKKIEADPSNPRFLRTVRGEGYIFSVSDGAGQKSA
jgi:DNA-binding response OmpR family regulator